MDKTALVTLMDNNFVIGYVGFIKSFLYFNPWFNLDIVVFDAGISSENKKYMRSFYPKIIFERIDKKAYSDVKMDKTHPKLQKTYYTLEAFRLIHYDRIVFMDMDIIVQGDIKELFECKHDFAACKSYNAKLDNFNNSINSGVFVVNKKYLDNHVYRQLIRIARKGFSMPDQRTINIFFRDEMKFLPKKYNVEKRMLHTKEHIDILESAVCIHYVASKPWEKEKPNDIEKSFKQLEDLWWKWYDYKPEV